MNTFCEHIAMQIGKKLQNESVLITGGGTLNKYLMKRISFFSNSKIKIPTLEIINYKESIIFAFLGILKIRKQDNALSSVTGAIKNSCCGEIYQK